MTTTTATLLRTINWAAAKSVRDANPGSEVRTYHNGKCIAYEVTKGTTPVLAINESTGYSEPTQTTDWSPSQLDNVLEAMARDDVRDYPECTVDTDQDERDYAAGTGVYSHYPHGVDHPDMSEGMYNALRTAIRTPEASNTPIEDAEAIASSTNTPEEDAEAIDEADRTGETVTTSWGSYRNLGRTEYLDSTDPDNQHEQHLVAHARHSIAVASAALTAWEASPSPKAASEGSKATVTAPNASDAVVSPLETSKPVTCTVENLCATNVDDEPTTKKARRIRCKVCNTLHYKADGCYHCKNVTNSQAEADKINAGSYRFPVREGLVPSGRKVRSAHVVGACVWVTDENGASWMGAHNIVPVTE